jgi:hypothetical protein
MADHRGIIANGAVHVPLLYLYNSNPFMRLGFNVHTYVYAFETGGASNFQVVGVPYAALCNLNKVLYGPESLKCSPNGAYH